LSRLPARLAAFKDHMKMLRDGSMKVDQKSGTAKPKRKRKADPAQIDLEEPIAKEIAK
jgi:hypothetical protein